MKIKSLFMMGLIVAMTITACGNEGAALKNESPSKVEASEVNKETKDSEDTSSDAEDSSGKEADQTSDGKTKAATDRPAVGSTEGAPVFPEFTSYTLDGEEITQDIFSQADLTVVNIWGTYCQPCILELPDLAKWDKELPDNIQIVGLASDVEGPEDNRHIDYAHKVLKHAKAEFTQIIANEEMLPLLQEVYAVPTTIFVNKNHEVVGEAIVGAHVDRYIEMVDSLMS